jgi:PTS system fructose-specific IIA component
MVAMNAAPDPVVPPEIVSLDEDLGPDGASVVRVLAARLREAGRVSDTERLVEAVLAREALGSTVLPGGIAMPHARSAVVTTASVAVARLPEPISWVDGADPVRFVLMIAAPGEDSAGYLALLQKVATACVKNAFADDLAEARSAEGLAEIVSGAVGRR